MSIHVSLHLPCFVQSNDLFLIAAFMFVQERTSIGIREKRAIMQWVEKKCLVLKLKKNS